MSDSIFNKDQTPDPNATQNNSVQQDDFANLLGSIKNERGEPKYRDLPTALEALRHSQEYIPQLKSDKEKYEQEAAELRREVERLKAVEETVTKLASGNNPQHPPQAPVGLDAEAVAKLVSDTLQRRESEVKQKQNLDAVVTKMQQAYGADAEKNFYSKAQELGISIAEMNLLAAKSPKAVFDLLGITEAKPNNNSQAPSFNTSTINTSGYQPQKDSFVGRNTKPVILGATTEELKMERENSSKLVDELHNSGLTTYDLTDPKKYFQYFGKQ